jgi:ribosomal protein S18 acetylase RimI-like enzyme
MTTLILAQENDFYTIAKMAKQIWYKHYPQFITLAQVDYFLNKFYDIDAIILQQKLGQQFYIIMHNNETSGFISCSKFENNLFIHKFYINTEMQRKNIGLEVIQYIQSNFKPIQNIQLAVNRLNIKSINFYFKVGFKIKSIENFDIDGKYEMNDFIMEKCL